MKKVLLALALVLVGALGCQAEEGGWAWRVTPYAWAMGIDGDVGTHGVTVPVDQSFSDLLQNLDIAASLIAEANNGRWGVLADGFYAKLSDDANTPVGRASAEMEQWIVQASALYRVSMTEKTTFDAGVGGRFYEFDTDINTPVADAEDTESWGDPLLVLRVRQQFGPNCFGVLAGDVGGFSVGSDLTWQVTAAGGYAFNDTVSMLLGYRYLDVDYDDSGFVYDVGSSGLGLGLQFNL